LSYLDDSQTEQTNKQTKTGKNITSLAEVIKPPLLKAAHMSNSSTGR